jgi:hypothetical protein
MVSPHFERICTGQAGEGWTRRSSVQIRHLICISFRGENQKDSIAREGYDRMSIGIEALCPRMILDRARSHSHPQQIAPLLTLVPVIVLVLFTGCGKEAIEPIIDLSLESTNIRLESTTAHATPGEMETVIAVAETLLVRLSDFVGTNNMPSNKIHIVLDGNWRSPGPYTEADGTIHLFRYPDDQGGYRALLAHELVHSTRKDYQQSASTWRWQTFGFFEEGFAEFVAMRIDPEKTSFPLFGYDEDAIVGHWVVNSEHVPMNVLRMYHSELNLLCQYQAYPTRSSWFRHLHDIYGKDAVLNLAYTEVEPTTDAVRAMTGIGLEELDSRWEQWVAARYAEMPDASAIAEEYLQRLARAHICQPGVDY